MSPIVLTLARVLLFPVFAVAIFVAYGHALSFSDAWIPRGETPLDIYGRLIAEGFVSAAAIALVFSYPLALVYRHNAFVAALFFTLPVLYFRLHELTDFSRRPAALIITGYEIGAFVVLLVVGAAVAHRQLSRSRRGDGPTPERTKGDSP